MNPEWNSANRYRILLSIDARGRARSNSPASVDVDFARALAECGGPSTALRTSTGVFDENTIEVVAYTASGRPQTFDASLARSQRSLLPWRVDRYFGISMVTLHFVVPDETTTRCAVYFDTVESGPSTALRTGRGKPRRYPGLVGDGDFFREDYKRREIAASHFDQFVDFDGDGDLDLFKGGVEPFIHYYENVGGPKPAGSFGSPGDNRFVDRGRLTSGGNLFVLPKSAELNRSWVTVAFYDWDGDGDLDFFPSFQDGPYAGKIIFYENTTREHGGRGPARPPLTFTRVGPLQTVSGVPLAGGEQAGGWFPSITFVRDWDGHSDKRAFRGDGRTDVLVGSNNHCYLYRNLGPDANGRPRLADAIPVQAGGKDIVLVNPRFDCADIDGDGDLDLFAATQPGPVFLFKNIGSRTRPEFDKGTVIAYGGKYLIGDAHSGIKVADFDGDGLLDFVVGRFWERSDLSKIDPPRDYGGFYKNVGTKTSPRFEKRNASGGAPHTEQFQICDAIRQNCVRATDWNRDGNLDLLAGDTDGFIWFFRNRTNERFPVFATGEKLRTNGRPLSVADSGVHARFDVCDWNNDGKPDLIIADGNGTVTLFLNTGSATQPALTSGVKVLAGGKPVQVGGRASVLVCDWNNDGKKDIVLADEKGYYFCENTGTDASPFLAAPQPITFDGKPVRYVRPNLGSFGDWDGDGKRDFIGCNFENSIRFYRNIGSDAPKATPQFASAEGTTILQPWTVQMISGAHAIDWNRDGDLDLLTGQGHGGSGLRFFERDYIDDTISGRRPVVTIEGVEARSAGPTR